MDLARPNPRALAALSFVNASASDLVVCATYDSVTCGCPCSDDIRAETIAT